MHILRGLLCIAAFVVAVYQLFASAASGNFLGVLIWCGVAVCSLVMAVHKFFPVK